MVYLLVAIGSIHACLAGRAFKRGEWGYGGLCVYVAALTLVVRVAA